jgi:hypothetical protein
MSRPPRSCRPQSDRMVPVLKTRKIARLDVLADGRVYHVSGGDNGWLSLNGIFIYNGEPSLADVWRPVTLANDWSVSFSAASVRARPPLTRSLLHRPTRMKRRGAVSACRASSSTTTCAL